MTSADSTSTFDGVGVAAPTASLSAVEQRVDSANGKRSLIAGQGRLARHLAVLLPFYEYDESRFFCADHAPDDVAARRRAGFMRLSAIYRARFAKSTDLTAQAAAAISDLQFTASYRVPFQFSRFVRQHLPVGAFVQSSAGATIEDVDGNHFYDLGGSYGVNVLGYDFYKDAMARAFKRVQALGPVLGAYHPIVADNVERLKRIAGLDEVSFHMSGTEAVMQAVRLARYHTRRPKLVRFSGAYHGWWGDVQPGIGNPLPSRQTLTLPELSDKTLRILQTRRDVACVLVNPLQALHPNANPPSDSALLDSRRTAHFDKVAYAAWLRRLRAVCTERNIALIFDEVFVGFRLARGGAQDYFGVQADLVTYGKTVGGGLPIGVVCGRKQFMKRFRDDRPADICFARGTFNAHPYVMAAMNEFLCFIEMPEGRAVYDDLDRVWDGRARQLNAQLGEAGLPVRVANLSSIWTVYYTRPSRYNWMLQYYLRAAGLALSWVGTGRLIFSLNYSDTDFAEVAERFVAAARAMQDDGWWWQSPALTNKSIRRTILKEMIVHRLLPRRPSERSA
jgi:glutamate-1-semialdehyde 2,1-aminomutase